MSIASEISDYREECIGFGRIAFLDGRPIKGNPFVPKTGAFGWWRKEWKAAQREARTK